MNSVFSYRDDIEGKIGIGKLPQTLQNKLDIIAKEYSAIIPDKNASTHHVWYDHMPDSIKQKVTELQDDSFWNKLCDGSKKCVKINASEMDELYYSNPKNNLDKINLYGAVSNYDIHRDCFFNFNGIKFYRILIGLTNGNNNIITYFNNFNKGHKLNKGDFIVFDFDNTTHQVIKEKEIETPRMMLKLHYIVCEDCTNSTQYINIIKNVYLQYEYITRYIMQTGTDPKTFYQFFIGLLCQYTYTPYILYVLLLIIMLTVIILKYVFKIKLIYKNVYKIIKYNLLTLTGIYISIVTFYWGRFQLYGIK